MKKISLLIIFLAACSHALAEEIRFSGVINIDSKKSFSGKRVIFLPGTKLFLNRELEETLFFNNCQIYMEGTAEEPIIVEGVGEEEPQEDKNLFHVEDSKLTIKHAIFKNGSWHLHIHNSNTLIENSFFEKSFGAVRFSGKDVTIRRNIFKENKIAIRFIKADPVIQNNIFMKNDVAIFLREGVDSVDISLNAFINNRYDLYGGFFQEKDVNIYKNYFLSEPRFFDRRKDDSLNFQINNLESLATFPDWH